MEVGGGALVDWLPEGGVAAAEIERPPGPGPGAEAAQQQDFYTEQARALALQRDLLRTVQKTQIKQTLNLRNLYFLIFLCRKFHISLAFA